MVMQKRATLITLVCVLAHGCGESKKSSLKSTEAEAASPASPKSEVGPVAVDELAPCKLLGPDELPATLGGLKPADLHTDSDDPAYKADGCFFEGDGKRTF